MRASLNHSSTMKSLRASDLPRAVQHRPRGRTVHLSLAGIAFASALALNWNWLAAIGIGPLLLIGLFYIAMHTLRLPMEHEGDRSASTDNGDKEQ